MAGHMIDRVLRVETLLALAIADAERETERHRDQRELDGHGEGVLELAGAEQREDEALAQHVQDYLVRLVLAALLFDIDQFHYLSRNCCRGL